MQNALSAVMAQASHAQKDEAPGFATGGPLDHNSTHFDCVGACLGEQAPAASEEKRYRTLQAQFALLGYVLSNLDGGGPDAYLVTRWNCCRGLPSLEAAEAFLRLIGGTHG